MTRALSDDATGGLVLRGGVVQTPALGRPRARLAGELLFTPLSRVSNEPAAAGGSALTAAVTYDVLLGPSADGVRPYAVLGLGASFSSATGVDSWPGFFVTSRTGVGVRRRVAEREVFLEGTLVSAVAGYGAFLRPRALWWPITVGFTF